MKLTKTAKISIKMNRSGIQEMMDVVDAAVSGFAHDRMAAAKDTRAVHQLIHNTLMLEVQQKLAPLYLFVRESHSFTISVPQALAFWMWCVTNVYVMDEAPHVREVNNNIHQLLI